MPKKENDLESQVLEVLADGPHDSAQLAERLGVSAHKIRPRLSDLYKAGRVKRTEEPPYQYSIPAEKKKSVESQLADLLQDTTLLEGERKGKNIPLPVALQNELRRVALTKQAELGLDAPDQCDFIAVGTFLLLKILEEGGATADHVWQILREERKNTRTRQGGKSLK